MNRKSFYRKVAYYAAIALLLLPLSWLGQPPVVRVDENQNTRIERGGKLAELRDEYDLSQAQLGDIDPASETMRLATLGMNGVAANILWHKTIHYHKVKDWSNFMASVNQIIKLQPNFIKVWEFQAHNVSYNTSVEFDDYKYRYAWVKRGIEFLIDGARYNRDEPRLLAYTGHFFGQKFGRADEATQFRRLFSQDRDFHNEFSPHMVNIDDAIGQSGYPDNWLVSRLWYQRAQQVVDTRPDRPLRGESPLIFHSHPAKSRINYAIFNEKDGFHGERARKDWEKALEEWADEYGSRQIPTSYGHTLRLNELENVRAETERGKQELEQLAGATFKELEQEKKNKLKPEEVLALDTPPESRTTEQHQLAYGASAKIYVTETELAERAPSDKRREADRLAAAVTDLKVLDDRIGRYRSIVNYDYWKTRCEVEMTALADQARQLVSEADDLRDKAIIVSSSGQRGAKETYEEAWNAWAQLFKQHPDLLDDIMAEELVPSIQHYEEVLSQLDEKFPEDFILQEILVRHDDRYRLKRQLQEEQAAAAAQSPGSQSPPSTGATPEPGNAPAPDATKGKPAEGSPATPHLKRRSPMTRGRMTRRHRRRRAAMMRRPRKKMAHPKRNHSPRIRHPRNNQADLIRFSG